MDPSAVTSTNGTSAAKSGAAAASQQLAGNFDTFLKLLTTQLQHQDPTSPMDSNQFTQQLVQFAGVEQQINANKNLEKLVNFSLSTATASSASYIGHLVTAGGTTTTLSNGSAHFAYTLGADAANTTLSISDAAGNVVYKTAGSSSAGAHVFTWDGRNNDGSKAIDGTYSISIKSTDAFGNTVPATTNITGIVNAVDIKNGSPMLQIGGLDIDPTDIITISPPPATADQTASN